MVKEYRCQDCSWRAPAGKKQLALRHRKKGHRVELVEVNEGGGMGISPLPSILSDNEIVPPEVALKGAY